MANRKQVIQLGEAPNARLFHVRGETLYEFKVTELRKDQIGDIVACDQCAPYCGNRRSIDEELCGKLPSCTDPKLFALVGVEFSGVVMNGYWDIVPESAIIEMALKKGVGKDAND